ncbi:molybdopterin-containing oxidoreductase family protein [Candidatus Formimonas warabiya]|uniref:Dehydrogenase n=1 Tax=Formimonas warabiya TaxID=1761012 RepID=A0A3G1KMG3_FORW1|nr:molybdopterin-dependent oxidoreductase [Candidatus Formimonas warabiya]ATW23643.1 dehydrogenase [Candidatus Formimonas warabiya]
MTEIRKVACHYCHMNCGMLAYVEDGVVTKVAGDPEHPYNLGAQCPRGVSTLEHLNHPNRINYPLKRIGERGSGQFKRVGWEEALEDIAARITELKNKYGAETISTIGGTNRTDDFARRRFFNLLGSPNVIHTAPVCWIPNFLTEASSFGWGAFDAEIMGGSKCCVVWGHNPGASYLPEMRTMLMAREMFGTKIIVIDPVFSETAAKADIWLPIRPNSDNALALAWLNVIINEGLYDFEFVENWTVGFAELVDRVQAFSPEWAGEKTGVSPEKIAETARLYAMSKPACIAWGVATDQLGRGSTKGAQARIALRAITGNIDVPGGDVIPGPHPTFITDWEMELNDLLPEEQRGKQIGCDRFKLNSWPGYARLTENLVRVWGKSLPAEWFCEAHPPSLFRTMITGTPYPVKASIILADNPLISYANSRLVYQALKSLDLLVAMEYWMTPSALLADYVLPAASWIERPVLTTTYGVSDFLIASQRGIQPLYERKTDIDFWSELGHRLGQGAYWPWQSDEEIFHYRLEQMGYGTSGFDEFVEYFRMDFAPREYKKYETKGFATPSGKVELKNSLLEELGYDPLPNYVVPPFTHEANPELAEKYPVILIAGGGFMPFFHSEHREITRLRLLRPDPRVAMNPKLADQYGIKEGDWVWIETPTGKIKQRAFLSEGIPYGYVQGERGWWFPEKDTRDPVLMGVFESNVNVLLNDDPEFCDEATGAWCTRTAQCRIGKVEGGESCIGEC